MYQQHIYPPVDPTGARDTQGPLGPPVPVKPEFYASTPNVVTHDPGVDLTTVRAPPSAYDHNAGMLPAYLQQMRQSRLAQILAQRAAASGGGVVSRPSVAGLTEAPAGLNNAAGRGAQQNGANIGQMPPMDQAKPSGPMSASASFSPRQQAVANALSPRPYRAQVDLGWVGTPGTAAPTGQTQSPQGTRPQGARPQQGGTGPGGRLF